jgi:pyridoxal phosphate-dependent aminotransferase EpsN
LCVIDERVQRKREIFEAYEAQLGSIPGLSFMPEASFGKSNRWLTVMTLDRNIIKKSPWELVDYLAERDIESRPVWKPMHLQPLFANVRYYGHEENHSVSDSLFETGICLPSGTALADEEIERVVDAIKAYLMS